MEKINQIKTIRPNGTIKIQTINPDPELTQQQFKEECDINNIIRKYKRDNTLTHINMKKGVYADLTQLPDYQDSLNTVLKANQAFESLPSSVRKKFANDPSQLIEFISDDKNYEEAIKLGLMDKEKSTQYLQSKTQSQTQPIPPQTT